MFHSTKLIDEASHPAEEPQTIAPAPKARRPRRALCLGFGGLAIAATVGTAWLANRPACACALEPISKEILMMLEQRRPVMRSGRATQAAPANSALAFKGSDTHPMVLRPDAMLPGAIAPTH
jgi:hypothetical protein